MMFVRQDFVSHSGLNLAWKIDCDSLTDADIETLAYVVSQRFKFGVVIGIPRGGIRFSDALRKYATNGPTLIVDDVLTTGSSMDRMRDIVRSDGRDSIGVVIFARGLCPDWDWITPIFQSML